MNSFTQKMKSPEPTIIAEIGVNHEGSVDVAANIITQLEGSGAAAVKLQSFTPNRYVSGSDPERLKRVSAFCLNFENHQYLKEIAHNAGLAFISTPLSEDWVAPLVEICDAIKIASGDIDFEPTIIAAAKSNLPVIMSTGTSTVEEVDNAVGLFESVHKETSMKEHLFLMHCISEYPALIEDCNLNTIPFMNDRYGLQTGWSNHVIGSLACQAAVALGAGMVEVHVTDEKEGRDFRDHSLSFEPHEIVNLVTELNAIQSGLGVLGKFPTIEEQNSTKLFRKGLIFSRNLKVGDVLSGDDILFARPAIHYSSNEKPKLLGKTLRRDVQAGYSIMKEDFQ